MVEPSIISALLCKHAVGYKFYFNVQSAFLQFLAAFFADTVNKVAVVLHIQVVFHITIPQLRLSTR